MTRRIRPTFVAFLKGVFVAAFILTGSLFTSQSVHAVTAGDWQAGNITDDVVFYNEFSMTTQQIQQFLNAKVPTCDNWGTKSYAGTTRRAYSEARGVVFPLTCVKDYYENPTTHQNNLEGRDIPSGAKSAAQIISDVSHQFHINPQVLIVLLQKEQGLTLDEWPWPYQYRSATGYGCPDNGAQCDAQYYGLYNQVYNAARQFRLYANSPNSFNHIPGQNNQVRFNPATSCGSSTVNIVNMATASLYNYTPYQPNQAALNDLYGNGDACSAHGNRNYWLFFNDWFGSTKTTTRWLRQSTANGQVWLVVEGQMQDGSYARKKWRLTSSDIYVAYGLQYDPVALVSEDYLSQFTDDGSLGTIATSKSYAEFQFFDSFRRYYIPGISYCKYNGDGSLNATTSWGFDCFNTNVVKVIPGDQFLERIPGAGQVPSLITSHNITYKMTGGKKAPIYDEQSLRELGYSWSSTTPMQDINAQQPLGPLQITHPAIVSFSGGPFLVYDNKTFKFHSVGTYDTFVAWGLYKFSNSSPAPSSYNSSPPTVFTPDLSVWATDSGGRKYIVDDGRKIDVTAHVSDLPSVTWQPIAQDLLDTLPTAGYGNYVWDRQTGAVYNLESGKKRLVPNWENFVGLGLVIPQLLPISSATLSQIPNGDPKMGDSGLFETSGGVFMTNGAQSYHVPAFQFFIDWRLDPGTRVQSQPGLSTAYPSSGELGSLIKATNGERFMVVNGQRLAVGENVRAEWGIPAANFVNLTSRNITRLPVTGEVGRFFLHGGGIYYGQGGQKHYMQSYAGFTSRGGDPNRLINMPDDVFNAIPLGTPIP